MDRRVTLLLFLSLLFSGAKASVVSISLKESEQRFSEHNLEVIAERYNIDIAEAQVVQAKLFENPVVSLEQNVYNRLNGRYFDFGKQGETIVEVEQLIYIAGQRNKRVRLEKIYAFAYVGSRLAFRGKIVRAQSVAAYKAIREVA